jgi:hypothetical protein
MVRPGTKSTHIFCPGITFTNLPFYTGFTTSDIENSHKVTLKHFQEKRLKKYTTMYPKVHFLNHTYFKVHFLNHTYFKVQFLNHTYFKVHFLNHTYFKVHFLNHTYFEVHFPNKSTPYDHWVL